MVRMIWASGLLHLVMIAGLLGSYAWWSMPVSSQSSQIYHVDLVSLPESSPVQRPPMIEEPYEIVSKKEASTPQEEAPIAMERMPKLVSEVPNQGPEMPESFETNSAGIRLDDSTFQFPYYLGVIQRKIQRHFIVPRIIGVKQLETVIYFRVRRSGKIYNVITKQPSSTPVFDLAAQRALNTADPLPPLPEGYTKSYLGVHFSFQYSL